jgi:hypothetical protein
VYADSGPPLIVDADRHVLASDKGQLVLALGEPVTHVAVGIGDQQDRIFVARGR